MPRPTAAQLVYGSVTVVFTTLATLLLSRTDTGVGVAVICAAALALGLLVAVTVPAPQRGKTVRGARTAEARATAARTRQALDGIGAGIPAAHSSESAGQHSLRR
ncbi:hypothetical protein OG413_16650 [Streptomyces sp. NBC_01433]|uniref:hypothetical protein n=1 Tax=Streptomyces sp. NBC_01433 TaxID=2903864 RepID=UPI00224EFB4F|nr:hypothetical protein [Streptomyces sp. NBC_01433]MCX4676913.1 hypothetical protein [Streptomyces sp. NBC_01433]